jgi:hypothetical protein
VEERPLPRLGGEVVLFIWIRDESIVGSHHGNVEVDEVAEEGRFVGAWVACGDCMTLIQAHDAVSKSIV